MASIFLEVLNQLHDHHVDFVIVGGVAAALHGGSRVTFDLDVVPSLNETSWASAVDVDLLVSESGHFDALRAHAVKVTLEHRTFLVASIDDLILMKRRAGRPQDLLDIAQLQDIQRRSR